MISPGVLAAAGNIKFCPVCQQQALRFEPAIGRRIEVECQLCGNFLFTTSGARIAQSLDPRQRALLVGALRNASERGELIEVNSERIPALIASVRRPSTPLDALDPLLLFAADSMQRFDAVPLLRPSDYPRFYLDDSNELVAILAHLERLGRVISTQTSKQGETLYRIEITTQGWQRVQELREHVPRSRQAFVAMAFQKELSDVFDDAIAPALVACGYTPMRVDRAQHNGKIDDFIVAELRRSGLVIADFTEHRGGVYFEAGFAIGNQIPLIWTCRADQMERSHFDTRQYNHIDWTSTQDLRRRLELRIRATLPVYV